MATGDGIDFGYFQYIADDATEWTVKVDKTWGADASSGLATVDATNPLWPTTGRYRPRKVLLEDTVSARTTSRILGTAAASAGVAGATVATKARGASGTYTLTSRGIIPERRPKVHTIISKAEPVTT